MRKSLRSSRYYWPVKLLLKRLAGRELWLRPDVRLPTCHSDGWDYAAAPLHPGAIAYCCGVGETISFETDLIERHGVFVHAFDPTPPALTWIRTQRLPPNFSFHPWAIAGDDGRLTLYPRLTEKRRRKTTMWTADPAQADDANAIEVRAHTLSSAMRVLGHGRIDMLKLDVEGAEYAAIAAMLHAPSLPTQLLVEFHHRFPGIGTQRTRDCLGALRAAGYSVFSISATGRELSLIRATATERGDAAARH